MVMYFFIGDYCSVVAKPVKCHVDSCYKFSHFIYFKLIVKLYVIPTTLSGFQSI
jgi:hypothetical protein